MRVRDKQEAIRLRKLGHSYREIMERLAVSKSSLSGWLNGLALSDEEEAFLQHSLDKKRVEARFRTVLTNVRRRKERDARISQEAEDQFRIYKGNIDFVAGILLYWAEGTKKGRSFSFINSDPEMISLMVEWIVKYLAIPRENIKISLQLHRVYANEGCENYWSEIVGIPVESFNKTVFKRETHLIKRNPEYKGCVCVRVGPVAAYVKTMHWRKLLVGDILKNDTAHSWLNG